MNVLKNISPLSAKRGGGISAFSIAHSFLHDGVDEYMSIPKADLENVITGSNKRFTHTFTFMKTDNLQFNALFGSDGGLFYRIDSSNKMVLNFHNGTVSKTIIFSDAFTTGLWYTIMVTYDYSLTLGNRVEMYINNVLATKTADAADVLIGSPTSLFYIARYSSAALMFAGYIGAISLVNRVLTLSERTDYFKGGKPKDPQALFGVDCKWFHNPDNSTWDGVKHTIIDISNSVTAESSNMEEADLTTVTTY